MTDPDSEDDYGALEDDLTAQILLNARLRDAQVPDSDHARHYQARATAASRQLVTLQANLPALRDLDFRLGQARYDVHLADDELARAPASRVFWGGMVTVGGLGCLVMAVAGWGAPGALAGVVLAVAGGFVVWRTAQRRRQAADDRDDAAARLRDTETERDQLLHPDRDTETQSRSPGGTVPLGTGAVGVFADAVRDAGLPRD